MIGSSLGVPVALWKRWGGLFILFWVLGGCAGGGDNWCADPVDMRYAASEDSLGVPEFLALSSGAQRQRRALADQLTVRAAAAGNMSLRLRALTTAVGLAPDDPARWLALGAAWRAAGGDLEMEASLRGAMAAVSGLTVGTALWGTRGEPYLQTMELETSLAFAWLYYARAQWYEAMRWTRAASRVARGDTRVVRLRGLIAGLTAQQGVARDSADEMLRRDEFSTDAKWVWANLNLGLGFEDAAFNEVVDLHPDHRWASACYCDMGRVGERVGRLDDAARWYREAAAAWPGRDRVCLTRHLGPRISDLGRHHELPFWVAFNARYVTGSLSAYLTYVWDRYSAATTAAERDHWGGLVVHAAGICIRLGMEAPHARRMRGLVFVRMGREQAALTDLQAAATLFGPRHPLVGSVEAAIGHLYLGQGKYKAAVATLRRAVTRSRQAADIWSDLGVALIMVGDQEEAESALTKAIAMDATVTAAWYNRGLMHLHAGHRDQALADLGQAAGLAPDNMEIARLLQRLRQGSAQ